MKKIITNIIIYILKESNLIDYKSSFKSHQQFKANTVYIKILQLTRKLGKKVGAPGINIIFNGN